MATEVSYYASIKLIDSRRKGTDFRVRIAEAAAQAYIDAADDAARAATTVGVLAAGVAGLTKDNITGVTIETAYEYSTVNPPALEDQAYNFDKILFGYAAGTKNYVITIPARKDANYTVSPNAIDIIIAPATATAQVLAFINGYEAIAIGDNGATPVDILYGKVQK